MSKIISLRQEIYRPGRGRWLIIGGHGFIGSHIAKELIRLDQEVSIYDIGIPNGNPSKEVIEARKNGLPESITLDTLCNSTFDKVIDCASLAGIRNGHSDFEFYKQNVLDLINRKIGRSYFCNYVYLSSSSIFGDIKTPYSISKEIAEAILKNHKIGLFEPIIIRPFTVYGENGRPEMFITKCLSGEKVIVNGNPDKISRNFTYVGDLVKCILYYADTGFRKKRVVNCIGKKSYSLSDVLKITGAEYQIGAPSPYDFNSLELDDAEIYECETSLEDFVSKYRKNKEN